MRKIIKSDKITATIDTLGAQLVSVKDSGGTEFLWSGDAKVWKRISPIMFPICGGLINDSFSHGGKTYKLPKHGFAQDMEFSVEKCSQNEVTMLLCSNDETRKMYPFDFEFRANFKIEENTLKTTYSVKNTGDKTMYFSLGAHEGYATPEGIEEYDIIFDEKENLVAYELDGNLLTYNTKNILSDSATLSLDDDYFVVDALVFLDVKSRGCTLKKRNGTRNIKIDFPDFDKLLLWHVHGGKYICIEPWNGIQDRVDSDGILKNKESIRTVDAGMTYRACHEATFNI